MMATIKIDFSKTNGKMKPMHAVNNGPSGGKISTGKYFTEAGIPYARLHDSAYFSGYGGEYSVDVHRIFPDFNADENDPNSYIFEPTDKYLNNIKNAGTEIYYRLGASIEHGFKRGTYPPKDYLKWARICEHIIRHYNEGWANGFHHGIKYWEIWNEADNYQADGSNPCWQSTLEDFVGFYAQTSKYLKEKFPSLKIGGVAIAWTGTPLLEMLLKKCKETGAPLDFLSYHWYKHTIEQISENIVFTREILDKYGFSNVETHLNEWNYVKGWLGEEYVQTVETINSLKGSSYATGVMCKGQELPVDMLMYYDARPCSWCGLFNVNTLTPQKPYYPFKAFGELYKMGNFVKPEITGDFVYAVAATDGERKGVMFTYYDDEANVSEKQIELLLTNVTGKAQVYLLDETKNLEKIEEFDVSEKKTFKVKLYTTYFIAIS